MTRMSPNFNLTPEGPRPRCSCPDETGTPHCPAPDCKRITPLSERLGRMGFEAIILALERKVCAEHAPGTMLNRILIGDDLAAKRGIAPTVDGNALAWCLSLGWMQESKLNFYGRTIGEAVTNAWRAIHAVPTCQHPTDEPTAAPYQDGHGNVIEAPTRACGKLVRSRVFADEKRALINHQESMDVCGVHANYWKRRGYQIQPLDIKPKGD